ncbi:E1 ubiquitin-activating protein uba2 [Saitoella coloradoensis]
MSRYSHLEKSLPTLSEKIKTSKVLMVGAGGIGCELLKNLALTGFGEIHMVDLDTIDLSNLNRQFLFRKEHIKKSKALVAKESAAKFNPNVKLVAHHANIKDPEFSVSWFASFDIVFNALDNLDARRYVNQMCLAADVPLIESGTTGFLGQVQVIKGGKTECYDCNPKEVPKSFPVCTIRSTPSQPIHCIVWAKSYLFPQLFGLDEEDAGDVTHTDEDNKEEVKTLRAEAEQLKRIRESMETDGFARMVWEKVFEKDVERLRAMEDMWKHREKPDVLRYDDLGDKVTDGEELAKQDQKVWDAEESFAVFIDSLNRLSIRLTTLQQAAKEGSPPPILSFDKDDTDTLDFVAAASNIRSLIFHIPTKSKFEIKEMAGNIIPAIATTNAIVAGVCVLQAFKVLKGKWNEARMVFLSRRAERVFNSEPLRPPNPVCEICAVGRASITVNVERTTIEQLVAYISGSLGYGEEISIMTDKLLYDVDFDDNLEKTLGEMGIAVGTFLTIVDENDADDDYEPRQNLVLNVVNSPEEELQVQPAGYSIPRKPRPAPMAQENDSIPANVNSKKRSLESDDRQDDIRKRGRVAEEDGFVRATETIEIEDDDGVITLD